MLYGHTLLRHIPLPSKCVFGALSPVSRGLQGSALGACAPAGLCLILQRDGEGGPSPAELGHSRALMGSSIDSAEQGAAGSNTVVTTAFPVTPCSLYSPPVAR